MKDLGLKDRICYGFGDLINLEARYGPFVGIRIIRIIVYWGLFWGPLCMDTLKLDLASWPDFSMQRCTSS